MLQHNPTYRHRVAKRMQHVVPNNVARCCVRVARSLRELKTGLPPTRKAKLRRGGSDKQKNLEKRGKGGGGRSVNGNITDLKERTKGKPRRRERKGEK